MSEDSKTNLLITTGTTEFPGLCDLAANWSQEERLRVYLQDPVYRYDKGKYPHLIYQPWINDFNELLEFVDLIITHAGAGTIFNLLNSTKNFVVCPNTERTDLHQMEICMFLKDRNYAPVVNLETLKEKSFDIVAEQYRRCNYNEYDKDSPFDIDQFIAIIS